MNWDMTYRVFRKECLETSLDRGYAQKQAKMAQLSAAARRGRGRGRGGLRK